MPCNIFSFQLVETCYAGTLQSGITRTPFECERLKIKIDSDMSKNADCKVNSYLVYIQYSVL